MAGIEENVAISGDWVPPSPSPRSFFSSLLRDGVNSTTNWEPAKVDTAQGFLSGSQDHVTAPDLNMSNMTHSSGSEPNLNSRGPLVERMAARAGFNAPKLDTESIRSSELFRNHDMHSPYLTIPPGLSPTTLLDSPVFLASSLGQPSPTTGKFSFFQNISGKSSTGTTETLDKSKEHLYEDIDASSFAFKPVAESGSSSFLGSINKSMQQQSFPNTEISVQSGNSFQTCEAEPTKMPSQNRTPTDFPANNNGGNTITKDRKAFDEFGNSLEQSPPLEEQDEDEADQNLDSGTLAEDGYNWRKYGQKQVKGSEYPRSYYKCTHTSCPVRKKVERSHEGHITEIIYKGAHNHSKPAPTRRAVNPLMDPPEQVAVHSGTDGYLNWATTQKASAVDWRHNNIEVTSSASEMGNLSSAIQPQNNTCFGSADLVDASSTFSNDEDEDDRATHGSVGYDGEGDESESKRRKLEAQTTDMGGTSRGIREPRVVVQTTSEVDILDDGYRWRKYGQKVVKGNPNPRSYYKCTNAGCTVRKHVERASHDLKSVITTYEGKHNHDVPAARNTNQVNPSGSIASKNHINRTDPSPQVQNTMARFDRSAVSFGSFRPQLNPASNFSFRMNQHGLPNMEMPGFGPAQPKMPMMPVHPYVAHQHPVNEMGLRLPKGEPIPKMEPISDASIDLSSSSSLYQQIMSRLPLGPHT